MAMAGEEHADEWSVSNFGGNQAMRARRYRPRNEQGLLDILARHRRGRIRAVGSLHSWSEIAVARDVVLDMGAFDGIDPRTAERVVRVGAGSTLEALLERLHAETDQTLPTLGVITKQTIAGACSTATHGTGLQTLSHFVTAVRFAAYDTSGRPAIFEYRGGDELRAARCALGSLGVIVALEIRTVPKYCIRDTVRILNRVEDALALYEGSPLSQFAFVPHGWKVLAWEREAMVGPAPDAGRWRAKLFRFTNLVGVDVLCHVLVKTTLALGPASVKALLKALPGLLIANVPRIDDARHVLTMRHDFFRHEEMELFVAESKIVEACALLRGATEMFAGDSSSLVSAFERELRTAGLYDELMQSHGTYVHHYPFFLRRVLPDDALVSMTSSATEAWFSISVFTYQQTGKRSAYYRMCEWLARALHALYGARLHWGKYYPLGAGETASMYPELAGFRAILRRTDPNGVFHNEFTDRVLRL